MDRPLRFAVIGCGIAGCTVSILLKRQGHEVSLFERAPVLSPLGAGVMLQPLGQCILERIGLLQQVIQRSEPIHEIHAVYSSGRTMVRMPFSAAGDGMLAYGVHRGDIFNTLLTEVRNNGIAIETDAFIQKTSIGSDGVELESKSERRYAGFDHVIFASGAKCHFRSQHHFLGRDREYDFAAIWCNVKSDQVRNKLFQVVGGTRRLMGILPLGAGRASIFWGIACRDSQRCMAQPIEHWKAELTQFYPWASATIDSIEDWNCATYGTYRRANVRPLFDSHHIFLGDAAHANSPHLGQGLNFALLDAYRFARTLEQSKTWEEAAQRFVTERKKHNRFYHFMTALLTPFFQSDSIWRGTFRDATLPWLYRTPFIRGQMALTMTGLKSGFFGNAMRWS